MGKAQHPSREDIYMALNPRMLTLVILPTEDCNFRCSYCYEDHVPGRMSPETVTGIKRLIDRRMDDIEFLRISWFGGEPLTTKDIVFDVSEFAHQRCQEKGVELAGDMTTNGYSLTVPVMARLAAVGHKEFFVSLAGIDADHDRLRPLASGKGTYKRIWANLIALQDSTIDFNMSIRLHFGTDVAVCEALCHKINAQFAGDSRFSISLQRIVDLGGKNTGKFATTSSDEARQIILHLANLLPDVQVTDLDPDKTIICTAARPNNLLIRTDGQISRCSAHLNDPRTFVGRLDADGYMKIDGQRLQPWLKGYDNFDSKMLACPYVAVPSDLWPQNDNIKSFPVNVVVKHSSVTVK